MFGKDKKPKKPKSKARKIIEWILTGIFAAGLVGIVVIQIVNKTSKNQFTFGPKFQKVLTDSMSPTYKVNDIIVIDKISAEDLYQKIESGKELDISFQWNLAANKAATLDDKGSSVSSMTHRVIQAFYYEEPQIDLDAGQYYHYTFVAHGINKHSEFCKLSDGSYGDCTYQHQQFHEYSIIGKVTRKSYFMTFATSIWGLLIFLLVPCMYLIISSVLDIFRAVKDDDEVAGEVVGEATETGAEPKKKDPLAGLTEEEKEKLKKQMLDEMLGKKK